MHFNSEEEARAYIRKHYEQMEKDRYGEIQFFFTVGADPQIRDANDPLFVSSLPNWTDTIKTDPVKYMVIGVIGLAVLARIL
jgi:hypothetical protein